MCPCRGRRARVKQVEGCLYAGSARFGAPLTLLEQPLQGCGGGDAVREKHDVTRASRLAGR
eukprot:scaffold56135_cov28-Tisochrysis_lutea.AAC.2